MINFLWDKPVDDTALNSTGFNPLHIAVCKGNVKLFEHIYEKCSHRFDINAQTGEGETVLHLAAKQGHVAMIDRIVRLGGDLSARDIDGHTPLHDCLQKVCVCACVYVCVAVNLRVFCVGVSAQTCTRPHHAEACLSLSVGSFAHLSIRSCTLRFDASVFLLAGAPGGRRYCAGALRQVHGRLEQGQRRFRHTAKCENFV